MLAFKTKEEKKNVIRLWVEALRSGKYSQCTGQLKDRNSYCCLGVLSEVLGIPLYNYEITGANVEDNIYVHVETITNYTDDFFYSMNDNFKLPFNDIADVIEVIIGDKPIEVLDKKIDLANKALQFEDSRDRGWSATKVEELSKKLRDLECIRKDVEAFVNKQ